MARSRKKTKKSPAVKILIGLNVILSILTLLSYLAPVVDPETTIIPAFFGLIFPALVISNILFIAWWLFTWKKYLVISIVTLLIGTGMILKHVSLKKEQPGNEISPALRILSYNVRLFDLYKWTDGKEYFTRDNIIRLIDRENADIVCLQEFFHGNDTYFPTVGPLMKSQKATYHHIDYSKVIGDKKHYGLATISAYPIINKGSIRFDSTSTNSGMFTDILFQKDTIRIFNVHLQSVRFSRADYRFVSEFIDPGAFHQTSSKVIFGKLKNAFIKRSQQARIVADAIKASPHPVVVCGDFNDTPSSFVYKTMASGLKDAFLETGMGVGSTYAGNIPFLRIDYILHSPQLEAYEFKRHHAGYSDHFPISCYLKKKKKDSELSTDISI